MAKNKVGYIKKGYLGKEIGWHKGPFTFFLLSSECKKMGWREKGHRLEKVKTRFDFNWVQAQLNLVLFSLTTSFNFNLVEFSLV